MRSKEELPRLDSPCTFGWITGGLAWFWEMLFASCAPAESFAERSDMWIWELKDLCGNKSFDSLVEEIVQFAGRSYRLVRWVIDFMKGDPVYSLRAGANGYVSYSALHRKYFLHSFGCVPASEFRDKIKRELEKYRSRAGSPILPSRPLKCMFRTGEIFILSPEELKEFILDKNFVEEHLEKLRDDPKVGERLKQMLVAIYVEALDDQERQKFIDLGIPSKFGISDILDGGVDKYSVKELIKNAVQHSYEDVPGDRHPFFVNVEDLPNDARLIDQCAKMVPIELEKLKMELGHVKSDSVEFWDCFHFR